MAILGLERHPAAACFQELNDAVEAMGYPRRIVFNAHAFPDLARPEDIVYNLENVGVQIHPRSWRGREYVFDFSARNVSRYGESPERWIDLAGRPPIVFHVPVGFHPSMVRFERKPPYWDVVFCGEVNPRRRKVLEELQARGLTVRVVPHGVYGKARDEIIARARLALNMLYYENGVFPVLRSAHCVANGVPCLAEDAPEAPEWNTWTVPYADLVDSAVTVLRHYDVDDYDVTEARERFQASPFTLPAVWSSS